MKEYFPLIAVGAFLGIISICFIVAFMTIRKQKEANDIFKEELDKREEDIKLLEQQNAQIASELAEREKNQEEREKTFNLTVKKYDDKNVNVEQIANNLNGMRPEAAVDILTAMDDQTVIDVLSRDMDRCREMMETSSDGLNRRYRTQGII